MHMNEETLKRCPLKGEDVAIYTNILGSCGSQRIT